MAVWNPGIAHSKLKKKRYKLMFCVPAGISGAVISSLILHQPHSNITEEALAYCGVNDCPYNNVTNPHAESPEQKTVSCINGQAILVSSVCFPELQWHQKLFGHLQILLLHNNYLPELLHNAS